MQQTLYLLDGHALVYKYFYSYASAPLTNSQGIDTGATFGVACTIVKILKHYPCTHIAVIFDPPGGSFRKDIYPEYKAKRKHIDIKSQLYYTHKLIKAWGIYTTAFEKLEADDAVASIAKTAEKEGFNVFILTRDKDYAQLVSESVKLVDIGDLFGEGNATIVGPKEVEEKWGVKPSQMIEYQILVGDSSDNIPGIKGIGPEQASKLLKEYGSITKIYENLESLTKTQKAKFQAAVGSLEGLRTLVTLRLDMLLSGGLEGLKKPENVSDEFIQMLDFLEFKHVKNQLNLNELSI
jgi:DNA polymerase-1